MERELAIFTDEPGWHGKALRKAFAALGWHAHFVSLCNCGFDLSSPSPSISIPGFDKPPGAAFVRGVAGGSLEQIIMRLNVLHGLGHLGIPVFNTGRAIERTVDKGLTSFLLAHKRIPSPRTWVVECASEARAIAERELRGGMPLVLKPLFGSQGVGVVRIETLADLHTHAPDSGVYYLQEYIDAGEGDFRDWRVFVIGGRTVAAMQRRSTHWVTNRAQGARCEPVDPDTQLYALAEAAAAAVGVDYAGVDLLRDGSGSWHVSEVNGIPAWQGLQRATGVDITRRLSDALVQKIESYPQLVALG